MNSLPGMKKYFDIFELDESASIAELEKAYKELSKAWHPENFQNFPRQRRAAQLKLQEITEAYGRLKSYMAAKPPLAAHHHQPASSKIGGISITIVAKPQNEPLTNTAFLATSPRPPCRSS